MKQTILRPTKKADTKGSFGGQKSRSTCQGDFPIASVGAYSVTPDRWPRIQWSMVSLAKLSKGTRHIRPLSCNALAVPCATFHGVGSP